MSIQFNKVIDSWSKGNCLCVGLDTEFSKIPRFLQDKYSKDICAAIVEFNKEIIAATCEYSAAYKINFAFYEQYGIEGMQALKETLAAIPSGIFTIADAKRGDIGNTSEAYARAAFVDLNFDSITVAPYMGKDSVAPFTAFSDKLIFVLALTSNPGSYDLQRLIVKTEHGEMPLFHATARRAMYWTEHNNIGFVVGATHSQEFAELRSQFPSVPFLVPGIGAQGGDLHAILNANAYNPMLVNMSRAVLYADSTENYAANARKIVQEFTSRVQSVISTF